MTEELNLKTPQDYTDLYKKMGCVVLMNNFFHMYDDIGIMCRVVHLSRAYAETTGFGSEKDPIYCKEHRVCHKLIETYNGIKELMSYCPLDPKKKANIHPRYYTDTKLGYGTSLVQYNENYNIWNDISVGRTIYFLQYLWNPTVLDFKDPNNSKTTFQNLPSPVKDKYITHYIPFLELDAADIAKNKTVTGRLDMMLEDVFNDFIEADKVFSKTFSDKFGDEFFKHTSGNGIYYIGSPIPVNSVDELIKLKRGFLYKFCADLDITLKQMTNKLTIDAPWMPWNNYYKIPFSLHKYYDRISLPLNPIKDLSYEFIQHFQNPLNMNGKDAITIWKEAGYKVVTW